MTPAEVLRKAADVIRARGWRQHDYGEESGPVCAVGALNVAMGGDPWDDHGPYTAEERLRQFLGWGDSVSRWNDARGRTVEEVIAALEKAASLAEALAEASK